MKKIWKYAALFTLILMGMMQAVPFLPTHNNCQAACCAEAVSCCETEVETGCEMAMTSCNLTLFVPLMSAPLIKVTTDVHLDIDSAPRIAGDIFPQHLQIHLMSLDHFTEDPPPQLTPLLI